jgi:hypothetical protein
MLVRSCTVTVVQNRTNKKNLVCQLCCALTQSFGGMLAARFFLGVGGCKSLLAPIYKTLG